MPEGVTDKPVTMLKSEKVSELGGTVIVENRLDTMVGGGEPESLCSFGSLRIGMGQIGPN